MTYTYRDKFETINDFARLSRQDKEFVIAEFNKDKHPFQIEFNIWLIIIPTIFFEVANFVFYRKRWLNLNNYEIIELGIIAIILFYFMLTFTINTLIEIYLY